MCTTQYLYASVRACTAARVPAEERNFDRMTSPVRILRKIVERTMPALYALVRHTIKALVLCATITTILANGGCSPVVPVAKTSQGAMRGVELESRAGRMFFAFRGVPYAKPPIGDLRFKEPQRSEPWDDVFEAGKDGNECTQKNYLIAGSPVTGQEDCLYLNVYTHKLPTLRHVYHPSEPVMVYFHGGGWFAGSGSSVFNGPEYLMDQNIVLVTVNYRLGAMGFLSTGDDNASGNWGLKDQVAALRWVKENIRAFCGDPDSVTIFGQSAGAASVHYHMLSPLAKGLFHRAISESGTALSLWARPQNPLPIAKKQAQFVGCPDTDTKQLIDCLRTIDAVNLTASGDNFKYWSIDPLTVFTPTVEHKTEENPTPFLLGDPLDLINSKSICSPVPWIVGVVANEGLIRSAPIVYNPDELNELNERFDELGPKLMEAQKSVHPNESLVFWRNITEFYLDSAEKIEENNSQGFTDLYSDRGFVYGTYQSVLLHAEAGHTPIYFYHFNYTGIHTWSRFFSGTPKYLGVCHCDELIYLFKTSVLFPDLLKDDLETSEKLIGLWTNFATYSTPTPANNSLLDIEWQSLPDLSGKLAQNSDLRFMNIERLNNPSLENCTGDVLEFKMMNGFYTDRMDFWSLMPIAENNDRTSFALNSVGNDDLDSL